MTLEEKATNFDTFRHIERVRNLLNYFAKELLDRGEAHDQSKLASPEVEVLTEHTSKLQGLTYDSPEYKANLNTADMKAMLEHHYARNRHHPQFHKRGVDDMDLVDLLEMICDWKAASERHNDGNIRKSIEKNAERFNMSQQLTRIFENTARLFDDQ